MPDTLKKSYGVEQIEVGLEFFGVEPVGEAGGIWLTGTFCYATAGAADFSATPDVLGVRHGAVTAW